jgi:TRAP-type C4-dicarboxylate transport system permease small subunit
MDTTLQILDRLNDYYNNGFGHLLVYTAILFGAIGIIVPIIIQIIQNRTFRHDAEEANK